MRGLVVAEELHATPSTNVDAITIQLFQNHAPNTVRNCTGLAHGPGGVTPASGIRTTIPRIPG